jgi:hypothetical protein
MVWGLEPTFVFPTASSDLLGSGKYQMGPTAFGSFIGNDFILGGLLQHWEDIGSGGDGLDQSVSYSWLNLFYFINLNDGWQVASTLAGIDPPLLARADPPEPSELVRMS